MKLKQTIKQIWLLFKQMKRKQFIRISFYYVVFLLIATVLLMNPLSWSDPASHRWDFFNSLFTVVSAFSTTGLIIFDTASEFNFFGQLIILILMLIGGFSLLFFKILIFQAIREIFFQRYKTSTDFYEQHAERGYLEIKSTKKMLQVGLGVLLVIEFLGVIFLTLYFYFVEISELNYYRNFSESLWSGIFHSVSATNNAGFDIFDDGIPFNSLHSLSDHYVLQIVFILQFFIGGLGLPVFLEIFEKIKGRWSNQQIRKRFTLFTKFSLIFYFITVVVGVGVIVIFEFVLNKEHIAKESTGEFFMKVVFNTLSTRSAGFSTADISEHFTQSSQLTMIMLMWIGCAPLSTGGGIKVTTFIVLFFALFFRTDAKNNLMIGRRSISNNSVQSAYKIAAYSLFLIFLTTLLGISNILFFQDDFSNIGLFEVIFQSTSAFGNVGLSVFLIPPGHQLILFKVMLLFSMLIGQIGIARTIRLQEDAQPKGSKVTVSQDLLF